MLDGHDVLEGFAADAEHLGRATSDSSNFDKEFYDLCRLDNFYIFDFKGSDAVEIPKMTISDLETIIANMKPGKACDYYQMTAEHLKHCGAEAKTVILNLINSIIENIY